MSFLLATFDMGYILTYILCCSLGLAVPSSVCGTFPTAAPFPLASTGTPQKTCRCQVGEHHRLPKPLPGRALYQIENCNLLILI